MPGHIYRAHPHILRLSGLTPSLPAMTVSLSADAIGVRTLPRVHYNVRSDTDKDPSNAPFCTTFHRAS